MVNEKKYNKDWVKYYKYLERLRQSGVTNMYGASPYLAKAFPALDKREASKVLVSWIENYEVLKSDGVIVRL